MRAIGIRRGLAVWNDMPERKHEEILKAFDEAILLAESEEENNGSD